jgi:hypothetical protein
MLSARCKLCNRELTSTSKVQFCGCPNQMRVVDDHVGAVDLSQVVLTNHNSSVKYNGILTNSDLEYQEARKKRRVRKINFEER